jgi:dihydroneopterin aldolase
LSSLGDFEIEAVSQAHATGERRIFIRELELIGSVGVHEVERRYAQRIIISVELGVKDGYDGRSDRLEDVYDYDLAVRAVKDTVDSGHFNLIETLAERIAQACLAERSVVRARVRVEKPDVLPSCRSVGIEIERAKSR